MCHWLYCPGIDPGGDKIFPSRPYRPRGPRRLLYIAVRWVPGLFPGGKGAWAWRQPLIPI